jgi:hypothetical protein
LSIQKTETSITLLVDSPFPPCRAGSIGEDDSLGRQHVHGAGPFSKQGDPLAEGTYRTEDEGHQQPDAQPSDTGSKRGVFPLHGKKALSDLVLDLTHPSRIERALRLVRHLLIHRLLDMEEIPA